MYASARRVESLVELAARGIQTLPLDVIDDAAMQWAVAHIEAESGSVGVLVNNAGYGLYGAVEEVPLAEARQQFETNFSGRHG